MSEEPALRVAATSRPALTRRTVVERVMAALEEMKRKLAEAETFLAAAKTKDTRDQWTAVVRHWRELISAYSRRGKLPR